MKRGTSLAWSLGTKQKIVVVAAVGGLAASGSGSGSPTFWREPIAYWGVVSGPFLLSLRVALPATVIAGVTGIASGYALAKGRFPGRNLLETIGSLPIILPPTVIGYYLLETLSPGTRGRGVPDACRGP